MSKRKRKHGPAERSLRRKAQLRRAAKQLERCIADYELSTTHAATLRTCWERELVDIVPNDLGSFDVFFRESIAAMPEVRALHEAMETCMRSRAQDFSRRLNISNEPTFDAEQRRLMREEMVRLGRPDPGDSLFDLADLLVNVAAARNPPPNTR